MKEDSGMESGKVQDVDVSMPNSYPYFQCNAHDSSQPHSLPGEHFPLSPFFSRARYLNLIFSLLGRPLNKYIRPLNTVTTLLRAVTQQQTEVRQMISKVLHAFLTLRF